jgi:hypothetical protein
MAARWGGDHRRDDGPIDAHLVARPGAFAGAQAILLSMLVGFPVSADDPAFAATRADAEPMIRGDPTVTLRPFADDDFSRANVTVIIGRGNERG